MGLLRRLLGAGGNDTNAPAMAVVPIWGPDGYSRRMSVLNALRANPVSPANIGPGVRPAPPGSTLERTASDSQLINPQVFTGLPDNIVNPALKTLKPVSSFPSTNVATDPVLFGLAKPDTAWSGWRPASKPE